jgi:hypothetical protein
MYWLAAAKRMVVVFEAAAKLQVIGIRLHAICNLLVKHVALLAT